MLVVNLRICCEVIVYWGYDHFGSWQQGCSLGLERLSRDGLETCFGTSRLISVLKVECLGLESLKKSNISVS